MIYKYEIYVYTIYVRVRRCMHVFLHKKINEKSKNEKK